jgi:hypothetical protein
MSLSFLYAYGILWASLRISRTLFSISRLSYIIVDSFNVYSIAYVLLVDDTLMDDTMD